MNCSLYPKNAQLLDKLISSVKSHTISIDTTTRISFQLVSHDKTLVLDLIFNDTFFDELDLKNRLITFPKQRFYLRNMKKLNLLLTEYILTFEYIFDTYIHRKKVFLLSPSLFGVNFKPICISTVDSIVLNEVFNEIYEESAKLNIYDGMAEIVTLRTNIKFPFKYGVDLSVDLIVPNIKKIIYISDHFDKMTLGYEDSESSLNFILCNPEVTASYFTAINS